MTFSRRLSCYFFYVLLLVVFVACSSGSDDALSISLSASPDTIAPGESSQLSWTVMGAEPITLAISPDLGIDELTSPITVSPTETTTYTLTASNDDGSRSDSVTITVGASAIADFAVTTAGLTAAFTWSLAVAEPTGCSLDVGDGSEVRTFDNCLDTQDATHTYASDGSYTATLTLASGESATVIVNVALGSVEVSGFVDEQSRNVVIILTDEDVEQAGTDLSQLNSAIATVEASLGVTSKAPAIRGMNAAVLGLLQTQQARSGNSTVPLFNFASEFVIAVDSEGEVLATSPLTRLGDEDDEDDSTRRQARLQFDIDIPVEQDVALLIAEPDGRGAWVCKSQLEYQTLDGQRTVTSEQTIYRFPQSLSGSTGLNAGAFQFNELTANPASRTEATSASVMADELPSDEVLAATVSLDDAPAFADGIYQFCNNPDIARNTVTANLDWRSDIFDVVSLPAGASEDLAQGEATVYDYGIAMLLETDTTEDEDGNLITNNRLVGTSPIDADGTLNINLVRSAFDNLDATLFFTDAAFFDAEKRRFPLTPSYQFDATAQANGTRSSRQGIPDADNIDLGTLEGGLAYISGQVVTEQGEEVAAANIIMVLDGTRLAFNVATADDTGFYELLIPTDLLNDYILYAQNPEASLAGLASNDDTGSRYEVPEPAIIDQDIILDVPLEEDAEPPQGGTPVASVGDNQQIRLGSTIDLEGSVSFIDPEDDRPRAINLDEGANVSNQDIANLILRWQILEAPEGSTAELTSTDTLTTSFTPDVVGRYRVRFSVFDGETLTADVIILDVFSSSDNTVLFLTPPEYDIDPIFNDSIELNPNEPELVTLERFGPTRQPLTVQFQVSDASTMTADEIVIDGAGFDAGSGTFSLTFPQLRSRIAFELTVPAASIDEAPERLTLELVESSVYDTAEPSNFRFSIGQGSSNPVEVDGCTGDFFVTTQSELEQLSGCTVIDGSLTIESIDGAELPFLSLQQTNDVVTSLASLDVLSEITGDLLFFDNDNLASLQGLDNLRTVGGFLVFDGNDLLVDFRGLDNLTSVGDSFLIGVPAPIGGVDGNNALVSLEGLNSLVSVGGALQIVGNDSLVNLQGLDAFSSTGTGIQNSGIPFSLYIENNQSLETLEALNGLTRVPSNLYVLNNDSPQFTSLDGLQNIINYNDNNFVQISDNDNLDCGPPPVLPFIVDEFFGNAGDCVNLIETTPPTITSFTAEPPSIEAGQSSTLSWTVDSELPVTITIEPDMGNVSGLDSVDVSPTETTTYTLMVESDTGVDTTTTAITVTEQSTVICDDFFRVTSQADLNDLESCEEIAGLYINADNITSLAPLNNLVRLGEGKIDEGCVVQCFQNLVFGAGLIIDGSENLVSLEGLENLRSVEGDVVFDGNTNLINFEGLNGLETIGGSLLIGAVTTDFYTLNREGNDALLSFDGFDSLETIGGNLRVLGNEVLLSLQGLDSLSSIGNSLYLWSNPSLQSTAGLRQLATIGGDFEVRGNPAFERFLDLENLVQIGGLAFQDNALTNLQGLNALEAVTGNFHVGGRADDTFSSQFNGSSVTTLEGLDNLRSIEGNFWVWNNPSLEHIRGLPKLTTVSGSVSVGDNLALISIEGFDSLIQIDGYLSIDGGTNTSADLFSSLTTFSMSNLETLGGYFSLRDTTPSLIDFDLRNLISINGTTRGDSISIQFNRSLESLNGLVGVTTVGGDIFVRSNSMLSDISGLENIVNFPETFEARFIFNDITREDCDALPFNVGTFACD